MELISNRKNTARNFHHYTQYDERITFMMCTIYFAFINAKYNGVIKSFTEDDIKEVAEIQIKRGIFNKETGGSLENGIYAVLEFLSSKGIKYTLLIIKDDLEVKEFTGRGFAVGLGIRVGENFYPDTKDGVLNLEDYKNYKGDLGHATNIIHREEVNKDFFLDSSLNGKSPKAIFKCDIDEVLEDIDMPTKYVIF